MLTSEDCWQRMLSWRGIDIPCDKCQGSGRHSYASTSTWSGGVGGCMITGDVCDECWGTGDKYKHGVDLRAMRSKYRALEHKCELLRKRLVEKKDFLE